MGLIGGSELPFACVVHFSKATQPQTDGPKYTAQLGGSPSGRGQLLVLDPQSLNHSQMYASFCRDPLTHKPKAKEWAVVECPSGQQAEQRSKSEWEFYY